MRSFFIIILLFSQSIFGMKIDRVILSTNQLPQYAAFWPLVAKAWKDLGIQPTLAVIGNIKVDESLGDVIYFPSLKYKADRDDAFYARAIRLCLPCLFPDDVCIISDIDMYPLNRIFFFKSTEQYPDDCFIVWDDQHYYAKGFASTLNRDKRWPMCYNSAKGSVFQEIFKIYCYEDIPIAFSNWYDRNYGYCTDERVLFEELHAWEKFSDKVYFLGGKAIGRINPNNIPLQPSEMHIYVDFHMPKTYFRSPKPIHNTIKQYYDFFNNEKN